MSRYRRFEFIEEPIYHYPSIFLKENSIIAPKPLTLPSFIEEDLDVGFAIDVFNPCPVPSLFEFFDTVTDLVRIERTPLLTYKQIHRVERLGTELYLQRLNDRVTELESRFERLLGGDAAKVNGGDRKYTWTAEIKGPGKNGFDRTYKWIADFKEEQEEKKNKKKEQKVGIAKNCKWTAEIKGKGVDSGSSRTYTIKVESGGDGGKDKEKEKKKDEKKKGNEIRIVEIEEPNQQGSVVLRQAFGRRFGAVQSDKGKKKELSPQDAALLIQMSFRAYLIHRSKALRALRNLAIAKSKLKEIRAQFNNFSYRNRVARDTEERQRFSEKIIVLLLTVDAIEGTDLMVRAAKKSMVDELEAMLDVVDPQPTGKSNSMKRRTFDMPDGVIRQEIAESVAQVVQMLNNAENSSSTFEATL